MARPRPLAVRGPIRQLHYSSLPYAPRWRAASVVVALTALRVFGYIKAYDKTTCMPLGCPAAWIWL